MSSNPDSAVLVLNAGSSSIKFALFDVCSETRRLSGKFERIGVPGTLLTTQIQDRKQQTQIEARDHAGCIPTLIAVVEKEVPFASITAVVHRLVHGGTKYAKPERVTAEMLDELRQLVSFAPEHLPNEIALIEAFAGRGSNLMQFACFDTAFHERMPGVARRLSIPRHYFSKGVRRYGFHGISYSYLLKELERLAGPSAAHGRVILAHLGNGASMAAVRNGECIDTTMGFTPAAGLIMSTRSGDLDPGLVSYFARTENMEPSQFHDMVNKKSGLLGLSETSSDVRDLLKWETSDPRAHEALESFCYQARKWIGALSAALGGLDSLVFSGGIGENSDVLRERICEGLEHLGIKLDSERNQVHAPTISTAGGGATVYVIPTDEELCMARSVASLIGIRRKEDR
jgi:acetate kinase